MVAWQYTSAVAKRSAGNFYYAFIFLPMDQRRAIKALYAFCRAGDDAADDENNSNSDLLNDLKKKLDYCYNERYIDPLTLALAHSIKNYHLSRRHFTDLFSGIEADLAGATYDSFEQLNTYCYQVASTVGLQCLKIFGCDNEASREYAVNLGIAMQMTNILRDVWEDYERGRVYLPTEDLQQFGLTRETLFTVDKEGNISQLMDFEINRTKELFRIADSSFPQEDNRLLTAAQIMGSIYRKLLDRIETSTDIKIRAELSKLEKLTLAKSIFRKAVN